MRDIFRRFLLGSIACMMITVMSMRAITESDIKKLNGTITEINKVLDEKFIKAPRTPNQTSYLVPCAPNAVDELRGLICCLRSIIGDQVNHAEDWESLIDAIECSSPDQVVTPQSIVDALALIADGLTEILNRIGCGDCPGIPDFPRDILGRQCYTQEYLVEVIDSEIDVINSKIDVLIDEVSVVDEIVQDIDSKVDVLDSKVDALLEDASIIEEIVDDFDSKIDVIDSKIDACCTELNSKVDVIDTEIAGLASQASVIDVVVNAIDSKVDVIDTEIAGVSSQVSVVDSKVDACCVELNSKVDVIDTEIAGLISQTSVIDVIANAIDSKVDVIDTEVAGVSSQVSVVESKVDACCVELNSKVDVVDAAVTGVSGQVTAVDSKVDVVNTDIGALDATVNCATALGLSVCDDINAVDNFSLVQWLKAIMVRLSLLTP